DVTAANLGTKYVTESGQTGWDLTGIVCSGTASYRIGTGQGVSFANGGADTYNSGDDTVEATLAAGKTLSCSFTNTKHATLTLNKTSVGGDGSFAFTSSGGGLGSFSPIATLSGSGSSGPIDVTAANLGTKYVTESGQTGWDLTGIVCSGTASYRIGTGQGVSFANGGAD